jgi:hypothetical protein
MGDFGPTRLWVFLVAVFGRSPAVAVCVYPDRTGRELVLGAVHTSTEPHRSEKAHRQKAPMKT